MPLQHPVPDEHLKHFGNMTVSCAIFAILENVIQSLAHSLLRSSQHISAIVTPELSFKSLRALVISPYLERYGKDSDFDVLRQMMNRASKIEEKRNQFTHSIWGAGKDGQSITRIKATAKEKHGLSCLFQNVTTNDLAAFALDVKVLAEDVQRFWISILESKKAFN